MTVVVTFQVCTKAEQEILNRGSKKSEKLHQQLMERGQLQMAAEKAVEQKNRLLEFDKNAYVWFIFVHCDVYGGRVLS